MKIKTINYCIVQCFYIINKNFTVMFSFDLVFGQSHKSFLMIYFFLKFIVVFFMKLLFI